VEKELPGVTILQPGEITHRADVDVKCMTRVFPAIASPFLGVEVGMPIDTDQLMDKASVGVAGRQPCAGGTWDRFLRSSGAAVELFDP
jgi:hypothetical protein